MSSEVDASIPLSVNTQGFDVGKMLSLADMAQQMRMRQTQQQNQNSLAQMLSNPQSYDPQGKLTRGAQLNMNALSPEFAMKYRQQQIDAHLADLEGQAKTNEIVRQRLEFGGSVSDASEKARTDALAAGKSEQDAIDAATKVRNELFQQSNGIMTPEQIQKVLSSPYDQQMAVSAKRFKPGEIQDERLAEQDKIATARNKIDQQNANTASRRTDAFAAGVASQVQARAANIQRNQAGNFDSDTLDFLASQYLAGDKSVLQNLGRGQQGAKDIAALRRKIREQAEDAGMSPTEVAAKVAEFGGLQASERAVGTRLAQVEIAGNEAQNMNDLARRASAAVPRGQFVPLTKIKQMGDMAMSDPKLARFVAANTSYVNAYARAISPTGQPHDSDKQHAYSMLNTAQSQRAYDAVLDQLKSEVEAAKKSPGQVRQELRKSFTGKSETGAYRPGDKFTHSSGATVEILN